MTRTTTPPARKPGAAAPARPTSAAPAAAALAPFGAPLPRLLSLAETAQLLGCSVKTLHRRIGAGELPVVRDGRLVHVHPEDLARFIAARRSL